MTEEISKPTPEKPKKSKWCLWTCGGVGCLVLIVLVAVFALRTFTDFNLGDSSSSGQSPIKQDEEDNEMSKTELLDYFVAETTVWPGYDQSIKVIKWEKPIVTVSIADTPLEGGIKAVDDFIARFNKNSNTVKLERIEKDGDIKIYFQEDTKGSAGKSGPSSGLDYTIDNANVKLDQKVAISDQVLNSVLSHEMFHALGFTGHYNGSVCRLMSPDTCGSHFSINEERLIQMLYSTNLPVESNESDIRAYFQNWNPK